MNKNDTAFKNILSIFSGGILLNHYQKPIMQDIGISLLSLKNLIFQLNKLNIKIQSIDSFHANNRTLALLDFWFGDESGTDYSSELNSYIGQLDIKDNYFYSINLVTDNPLSVELNILLDKLALEMNH